MSLGRLCFNGSSAGHLCTSTPLAICWCRAALISLFSVCLCVQVFRSMYILDIYYSLILQVIYQIFSVFYIFLHFFPVLLSEKYLVYASNKILCFHPKRRCSNLPISTCFGSSHSLPFISLSVNISGDDFTLAAHTTSRSIPSSS